MCPEGTSGVSEVVVKPTTREKSTFFKGQNWESIAFTVDLRVLRGTFCIPHSVALEAPGHHAAVVDDASLATKVALFLLMFATGLRLTFCHLIRNVLDYLNLAPVQLHPNAWQLLVASYASFHLVLSPKTEEYPNLTMKEFLSAYRVLHLDGHLCSFSRPMAERRSRA